MVSRKSSLAKEPMIVWVSTPARNSWKPAGGLVRYHVSGPCSTSINGGYPWGAEVGSKVDVSGAQMWVVSALAVASGRNAAASSPPAKAPRVRVMRRRFIAGPPRCTYRLALGGVVGE